MDRAFVNAFMRKAVLLAAAQEKIDHKMVMQREKIRKRRAETWYYIASGFREFFVIFTGVAFAFYSFPFVMCGLLFLASLPVSFLYVILPNKDPSIIITEIVSYYSTNIPVVLNLIILRLGPNMPEHVYIVWNATAKFVL